MAQEIPISRHRYTEAKKLLSKAQSKAKKEQFANKENHPMFGKSHSEESKKKISENNKGKIISLELREIIRKTNTGNKYCLGRKASE